MIYGSHNALSGYKPLHWYKGVLNFTSKCQSKKIKEQLLHNTRYFDIRLCKYKDKLYGAHGLMIYNITLEDFFKELINGIEEYNITDTIYFRVMREDTMIKHKDSFSTFVNEVMDIYSKYMDKLPNVKIIYITSKSDWGGKVLIHDIPFVGNSWYYSSGKDLKIKCCEIGTFPNSLSISIGEMYVSRGIKWLFGLPIPKYSAKKLRSVVEYKKFKGISVIDFI